MSCSKFHSEWPIWVFTVTFFFHPKGVLRRSLGDKNCQSKWCRIRWVSLEALLFFLSQDFILKIIPTPRIVTIGAMYIYISHIYICIGSFLGTTGIGGAMIMSTKIWPLHRAPKLDVDQQIYQGNNCVETLETRNISFQMWSTKRIWLNDLETMVVGGWTNPSEKYARQIGSFPQESRGENSKKSSKPPPSIVVVSCRCISSTLQKGVLCLKNSKRGCF